MLMPKRTKFRKQHRGRMKGISKGATELFFGDFGVKALEPVWLNARQIEALRVAVSRKLKKTGSFVLRVFPDKPVSKKPAEVRMGGGKAATEFWVAVVKRERILFEVLGVDLAVAKDICKAVSYKLPIKVKLVCKENPVVKDQQSIA